MNKKTNIKEITVVPKEKKIVKQQKSLKIITPENLLFEAVKNGASLDMLERLMNMQERIQTKQAETAFRDAMSGFQSECPIIPKTQKVLNKPEKGGGIRYKYATLDTIVKLIQPLLNKYGFSYNIKTIIIKEPFQGIQATITISHLAGHSETSSFDAPMDKDAYMTEPQKWLSAATFAKRICFCNGFGIMTGDEDNDANILITPEELKKKEDAKKVEEENLMKLKALPDNIKSGFKALGYTAKAVWTMCDMYSWDNDKISKRLNEIANGK